MPRQKRQRRPLVMPVSTIEAPCHEIYVGRHYAMTQLKDLQNPSTAFDDKVKPTLVYRPSKHGKRTGLGAPWDNKDGVEKPLLPLYVDAHKFPELAGFRRVQAEGRKQLHQSQHPIKKWYKLPLETQDLILRYLLLWHRDIILFRGWTLLYPQSKPHLSTSVLATCSQIHQRGIRILYGENSFLYEVRDPQNASTHEAELVKRGVYAGCHFPFEKHGGLLRKVRICIEPGYARLNHNRRAFMEALEKLIPKTERYPEEKNFGSLTIEIPAVTELTGGVEPMELVEDDVPICSLFNKESTVLRNIIRLKPDWLRLRVKVDNSEDVHGNWFFATDIDLRGCFGEGDDVQVKPGWQSIEEKENDALRLKKSKATLGNLSFRLFQLARDPYSTLSQNLWQRVQEVHHEELHKELGDTLLDDYNGDDQSKPEPQLENPFTYLRQRDQARRQDKLGPITSWIQDIRGGPADNEDVPEIDVFAYNHRQLRFTSAEPSASHVLKGWVPCLDVPSDKARNRNGRCPSLSREPDMTTFSGYFDELIQQKNLLAELRTDKRPIKTAKGKNLRASTIITSRKIRMKLRQAEMRNMASNWAA